MKQLCSPVLAFFRHYSSAADSVRPRWWIRRYTTKGKIEKTGSPKTRRTKIEWTEEQSKVLSEISKGKSVFVSGSAGTGKTILVEHIIKQLKGIHGKSEVFVTASTGLAACALNGMTLHSFSGTGLGDSDKDELLLTVISNKRAYARWNKAKALVIDEISMISSTFFEKLEYIARNVRDNNNAWGGIQLVVSGDFFQLPPISKENDEGKDQYAFEADCWDASFDFQMELTKVFRQSDIHLVKLLQGIRKGKSDPEDQKVLQKCYALPEDDPSSVQLFPRLADVRMVNKRNLLRLKEDIIVYKAIDVGVADGLKQLRSGISPECLELSVGARVMLCKNVNTSGKLVNGATGTIIGFMDNSSDGNDDIARICSQGCLLPVVKFDFGKEYIVVLETWVVKEGDKIVARRKQIPLILAWALSIHKCQGMTLESLHTDLRRAFGCGMVYVALSRVRTLDGLHLSGFSPDKIKADPKVLQFYENFSKN